MHKLFALCLCVLAFAGFAGDAAVAESPNLVQPLLIGSSAPDAALVDMEGQPTSLAQLRAGKPTVVIFYRGSW